MVTLIKTYLDLDSFVTRNVRTKVAPFNIDYLNIKDRKVIYY